MIASINAKKWDKLSVALFKIFLKNDVSKHYAMKIFLMHDKIALISPFQMNKAKRDIQNLDVSDDCVEIHNEFL